MIRAVLDTNVLVSALLVPLGNEAQLLVSVRRGKLVPCISAEIVAEYEEVLNRRKFPFRRISIDETLELMQAKGLSFEPKTVAGLSPDPEDDALIACAFAAEADYLVTGNRRHFPQEACGLTKVVSARELLEILRTPGFP